MVGSPFCDSTTLLATAADSRNDVFATAAVLAAALVEGFFAVPVDGFVGLGVALFILYSGVDLAKQTISPLLGEAASPQLRSLIVEVLEGNDRVLGWHDLMVHDYGPGQRFASIHVEMDQKEDPLVCHEIIDDMDKAMLLKGKLLYAAREDFALEEGEFFLVDMIGLDVIDADNGIVYGKLTEMINRGASDIYVVQTKNGERMIPAVDEFIISIDINKGIFVRPIEGMLD